MPILSVSIELLLFGLGAGVLQAFLLAGLLLFHPRSEKTTNKFLAVYVICVSVPMMMALVQHLFSWQYMLLLDPFAFLIAPALFFYVRSFMERISWKKVWPHLIIFFLCLISDYWFFFKVIEEYPLETMMPQAIMTKAPTLITINLRILVLIIYIVLSFKKLASYQRSINNVFSETSKINMAWVKWLISGFLVLVIILTVFWSIALKIPEMTNLIILLDTVMITPYIYMATLKGFTQPAIWKLKDTSGHSNLETTISEVIHTSPTSYSRKMNTKSKSSDRLANVSDKLVALIETEKLFQEPELTLQDIATKLALPSYQVSQIINDGLNKSFYDLINGYRVEEAKRLLLDPKSNNYTILAVGFEAGFNSKTTFNTVFKKFTGQTPTEYRDANMPVEQVMT